ncbi:MAG: helix-turn-helix domain containing protein [Treponema sp.]|jgi:transcriptional regulator with XRE-family HTH domain|nr:helix-turn-helix domain containing protein [Treponema sp.]
MNAEQFWLRVKKEVDRQHTSFEWLYRKTNIAKGTFSSWKNRNIIPRADAAYRIADALDVSVEYLLTGMDTMEHASNTSVQEIVDALISLDQIDLNAVKALVQALDTRYT